MPSFAEGESESQSFGNTLVCDYKIKTIFSSFINIAICWLLKKIVEGGDIAQYLFGLFEKYNFKFDLFLNEYNLNKIYNTVFDNGIIQCTS